MHSRRRFLGTMSLPAAAAAAGLTFRPTELRASAIDIAATLAKHPGTAADVADDEDFWFEVQGAFTVDRTLVNLNNGGVSPAPRLVQEAMKRHQDYSNLAPTYTMWQVLEPQREATRARMAREWGVGSDEVAFTRNASESLQTLQLGIDLQRGDEVLTTTQDYGRMITTFQQRERREGIVLKQIRIPVPAEDPAEIVRLFEAGITPKTRMILACHMINLTGQILPVTELTAMARRHGIPLVIDGAHALAHFDFDLGELDVDNYSASLHKWLFAPHGTGFLYVRRDKIADVWPLMAAPETQNDDIRKFEAIGTHPEAPYLCIGEALSFHQGIGPARKAARLVYLRDYWADPLLENDNIRLHTSRRPGLSCGIANVEVVGLDPNDIRDYLWNEHRIITVSINHDEFRGLRISPSVYTTRSELDRFVDVMDRVAKRGLPA
ncbi:MAG: aminotransferase class V-fold PLP-dependent enzyme [Gemmatimonadetes bacterium]|nr:aminotransferase class V-fold PLP-dependent enzyme [Gemmatimonadota bacterium]MDA1104569.1 aminotransferase class V-fold PLP-dependent enzyme [Gemmatimonadota bacterium]